MLSVKHGEIAVADHIDALKEQLDAELKAADPKAGIAFGLELFAEFGGRGWFTRKTGPLGFSEPMPFYQDTHHAFAMWDIPVLEYKIAKP